ncbi:hypothetical protein [Hymenobacter sp. BRD67]|uniref:hypothetical protein n=1 Tax=Hymenobacter sp. BRD67 TaxID=2675877 RepID=UPI00156541E0|nr:hypothetical protein [Hymenobacter sp. BRD67]QKG53005.1 hypothetical protein GKZ67_10810 [Hymenobacter sp. BRD67]
MSTGTRPPHFHLIFISFSRGSYRNFVAKDLYSLYSHKKQTAMKLEESLKRFEEVLFSKNEAFEQLLFPGINQDEVTSIITSVGLNLSEELSTLYRWRNGINFKHLKTNKLIFGISGVFLPLKDAVSAWLNDSKKGYYTNELFPIFFDETHLINIEVIGGPIYIYSPPLDILDPISIYDSLDKMFITLTQAFEKGYFYYNNAGIFESKDNEYSTLAKTINPNSIFWQ